MMEFTLLAFTSLFVIVDPFAWVGKWIFKLFGITLPAFQMAGSIVLLL